MKTYTKLTALASTILLSVALAGPANAASSTPTRDTSTVALESLPISAAKVSLKYAEPVVKTTAAPLVVQKPAAEILTQSAPVTRSEPVVAAPATAYTGTVVKSEIQSLPAAAPSRGRHVAASGNGASIAAAAYAQIGVSQDCTMLVTNSLKAVGINFHGWPAEYKSLGQIIPASAARAGDLAYYDNGGSGFAHIAVYVGNGMAVHGGWNGGTTSLQSVNVGSGPVFIRVA